MNRIGIATSKDWAHNKRITISLFNTSNLPHLGQAPVFLLKIPIQDRILLWKSTSKVITSTESEDQMLMDSGILQQLLNETAVVQPIADWRSALHEL